MKKFKIKKSNLPILILFILGLGIALYPLISQLYYYYLSQQVVSEFTEAAEELPTEEVKQRLALARAYNETIDPSRLADPFTEEEEAGRAEYARMLEVKEQIGNVKIPKLLVDIPIYAGTSPDVLEKGAGHLEGTSLPVGGNNTHTVITAHRGLPTARLFTDLDKLEVGDRFYITNIGETLAYQVNQIITVEPTDFEPVLVSPGHDYATLLTCTPYMVNSHRLLVRGHRIEYTEAMEEEMKDNRNSRIYQILFFITLTILLFLILKRFRENLKKKRQIQKEKQTSLGKVDEKNKEKNSTKELDNKGPPGNK